MSGFFGILRTDGAVVEPRFLDQVAERLRFSGPDGGQTWANDGLGTCFAYLDTGTRHQTRCQPVQLGERYTLLGEVRLDEGNSSPGCWKNSGPRPRKLAGKIPGEYLFKRSGAQQIVELHTEKTFRYYPRAMRIEDLYAWQRSAPIEGREVPALCLEDEFVLNCIHGTKHFWERLMWPADIAAIVARPPGDSLGARAAGGERRGRGATGP